MSRGNLFMLVLVIGMGLYFYLHDVQGASKTKVAETQAKRFFPDIEKKDVTGVKVEKLKDGPFVHEMNKENGVWVLQGKDPAVMRTASMGQAVKSLVELQRGEVVSGSDNSKPAPADFGLDKPSYRLTLKDRKGTEHSLLVGEKTPDESGFFVSPAADKPISTVATTMTELLDPAVDNQREQSPLVFEPSTANKIILESSSGPTLEVSLVKPREDEGDDNDTDDGMEITDLSEEWKITKPEAAAADAGKVRDLLFNWRSVKLGRFMKNDEKVNFGADTVKLTVYVDRQSKPFVLEVGQAVPGKPGLYYARRTPPNEAMVLEIKDFKLLEPKLNNILQRHLYVFQPEEAVRLEAVLDKVKFEASKDEESWKVASPKVAKEKLEAQKTAASDLVWEVKNMEWASQPDAKSVGEWKERATVELWGEDKKSLAKVSVGQLGPNGQGAYVRDGAGKVYLVEKDPWPRLQDIKLRLEGKGAATPPPTPQQPFVLPGH